MSLRTAAIVVLAAGCARPAPAVVPAPAKTLVVPEAREEPSDTSAPLPERSSETVTASGLRVEDVTLGSGAVAEPGRRIRVHYVGTLVDGSVFDSTRERGTPFEVELGKGHLIKGFEEGVAGMRVGGVRRVIIPPELGYGANAAGKIPASSVLVFELELLEVR